MTTKLRAASFQNSIIDSAMIPTNAITSAKIAENAVGSSELDLTADYTFTGAISGTQRVSSGGTITTYNLGGTKVWDAALSFTYGMYKPNTHMCLSFTGPFKHFKLSKGGAIITDDHDAYLWFKRARYSGRRECSYHDDNFDMLGWNFYMMPELAARGLLLMGQFWNGEKPIRNKDKTMPYPDLSKFPIYNQ